MAQGLKIGETVSLIKAMRVGQGDPAYAQGLTRLKRGQIGQVVEMGPGRSVAIEFDGKRIVLPSRRVERVQPPNATVNEPIKRDSQESTSTATDEQQGSASQAVGKKRRGRPPAQRIASQAPVAEISNQEELPQPGEQNNLSASDDALYSAINYDDPRFITAVANKLLLSGRDPETLLVQIRLSDLPPQTSRQVDALIQAKLSLGLNPAASQASQSPATAAPKRRGRKPKQR